MFIPAGSRNTFGSLVMTSKASGMSSSSRLWSAANIKVYGGGVAEDCFLRALSDLIGDYSYTSVSVSTGKSGRSRSRQEGKEHIFDVSNLAEVDRGRAVVLASGASATLVRTLPWYTGPHKVAGVPSGAWNGTSTPRPCPA